MKCPILLYILDCSILPCLLEVLEKMQVLETESHLCIQSSVGGVTLQQNFILQSDEMSYLTVYSRLQYIAMFAGSP